MLKITNGMNIKEKIMKKIFLSIVIFLGLNAYSQNEDTVIINDSLPKVPKADWIGDANSLKNDYVYYVKTDGETDASVTGGEYSSFLTASDVFAKAATDGVSTGGYKNVFYPGVYTENITVTHPNLNLEAHGGTNRGLVHLTGNLSFNSAGTSNGLVGVRSDNTTHSGSAGLYIRNVQNATNFTKDGSGYTEVKNSAFSGVNDITGTGATNFVGSTLGILNVNNASQTALVKDAMTVYATTLTAGTLSFDNNFNLPVTLGGNAVTTLAGSVFLDRNTAHYDLDGSFAPLSIAGFYSASNVQFDFANSTITGTNLGNVTYSDRHGALNPQTTTGQTNYLVWDSTDKEYKIQTGSPSGGGANNISTEIIGFLDVNSYDLTPVNGDTYIFQNVANIDAAYGTITGLGENDVVTYDGTNFVIEEDVSAITVSGEVNIYDNETNRVYYYDTNSNSWTNSTPDDYRLFIADTQITGGQGVSVNADGTVQQVSVGQSSSSLSLSYSQDYADNVHGLVDGARHITFAREGTSYKMYVNSISGFTITNDDVITVVASGFTYGKSFVYNGGNTIINVIVNSTGTDKVQIIPYTWNGTNYVAGTTYAISQLTVTKLDACLNANNTLELRYNTATDQYTNNAFVDGSGAVTVGTETLTSNTLYGGYKLITADLNGKYLFTYNDGANKYVISDTATNLTRTDQTEVTMTDVTSVDGSYINGDGKAGTVITYYNDNNSFKVKWFDLVNNTAELSSQSEATTIYSKLVFGNDATGGAGFFINNSLPAFAGWVRNGNGISISKPLDQVGTRFSVNGGSGNSITYNGDKYFMTYAGDTAQGNSTPRPECALGLFTIGSFNTVDGIAQHNADVNKVVKVALNGSISSANTGLTAGNECYMSYGDVVQYDTGYKIGKAISSTDIILETDQNYQSKIDVINSEITAIEGNVSTNVSSITSTNNDVTAIDNRVTSLEANPLPLQTKAFWTNKNNTALETNVRTTTGNKTLTLSGNAVFNDIYFGVRLTYATAQSGFMNFDHTGIIDYNSDYEIKSTLLYNSGSTPPGDGFVFMLGTNVALPINIGMAIYIDPYDNTIKLIHGNNVLLASRYTSFISKYGSVFNVKIERKTIFNSTYINVYLDGSLDASFDITNLSISYNNNFTIGSWTGGAFAFNYVSSFEIKQ